MGTRTVDVVNRLQMIRLPRLYVVAAGLASEVSQRGGITCILAADSARGNKRRSQLPTHVFNGM